MPAVRLPVIWLASSVTPAGRAPELICVVAMAIGMMVMMEVRIRLPFVTNSPFHSTVDSPPKMLNTVSPHWNGRPIHAAEPTAAKSTWPCG